MDKHRLQEMVQVEKSQGPGWKRAGASPGAFDLFFPFIFLHSYTSRTVLGGEELAPAIREWTEERRVQLFCV